MRPISITENCELKAVTVHHGWIFEDNISEVVSVTCEKKASAKALEVTEEVVDGLSCEIYSVHHTIFEQNGLKVYIDGMSLQYMDGAHVDYVDDMMGGGFKIENPNATSS